MSTIFESSVMWKLLSFFLNEPWREAYVKELAKRLQVGAGSASVLCRKLDKEGLMRAERKGNMLFYKLERKNPIVRELQKAFLLEKLGKANFAEKFLEGDSGIISLAVYGSYVEGKADEKSDLDVLVITNSKVNFSEVARKLTKEIKIDVTVNKFTFAQWKKLAEKNDVFYREVISNSILFYGGSLVV